MKEEISTASYWCVVYSFDGIVPPWASVLIKTWKYFSLFILELMWWTQFPGKLDSIMCETEAPIKVESYLVPLGCSALQGPQIGWEKQDARSEVLGTQVFVEAF